jgi:dTDP-L-rhamnose 4-epimerase
MLDTTTNLREMRVLVTGGAGFIGCALSQKLVPEVAAFRVIDNLHPQVHPTRERPGALHPGAELIVADVTEAETWDRALSGFTPDIVVHLAAETGTGQSLAEASRHGLVNVVGTTRLTDALGRHQIVPNHLLLASSRAIYGEGCWKDAAGKAVHPGLRKRARLERGEWDFPGLRYQPASAAATRPSPTSVYGATKLAQEHILQAWATALKVPLSILRFQNVYGPGQSLTNSYTGIVALFSRIAREGGSIPLYEDGAMVRDFVFIDDIAEAIVAALRRPSTRVCDVGSGRNVTVSEMASLVAARYGARAPHVCGKFRDGDVRHASCDLEPTLSELGWMPRWSLERGLEALQAWIDTQPNA